MLLLLTLDSLLSLFGDRPEVCWLESAINRYFVYGRYCGLENCNTFVSCWWNTTSRFQTRWNSVWETTIFSAFDPCGGIYRFILWAIMISSRQRLCIVNKTTLLCPDSLHLENQYRDNTCIVKSINLRYLCLTAIKACAACVYGWSENEIQSLRKQTFLTLAMTKQTFYSWFFILARTGALRYI